MSVWHRFMVWIGLRPSPTQPEPVTEPTKPIEPNMVDVVTAAAQLAAKAVLLKISERPHYDDINAYFDIKGVDVFMGFKLFMFEQPEGYHAVFLHARVNPTRTMPGPEHFITADDCIDFMRTKYCHARDSRIFEDAFFAELGDVVRQRPNHRVPLVGDDVMVRYSNDEFCYHRSDKISLKWFIGTPEITPTETPEYTPDNHDALLVQQAAVQTQYRLWLADKLAFSVQDSAKQVIKQLTEHLTNTSHLVTNSDGIIRNSLDYGGCVFSYELNGHELTLLTEGYIDDHRYRELMVYVWDLEQFRAAYQGWMRSYLERELAVATNCELRWVVETLPLEPVRGDEHSRIGFVLREVKYV